MVKGIDRPIANTYWVEPGRLLAGEYPGAPDPARTLPRLDAFLAAGVQHFIDLTEVGELAPYAGQLIDRACAQGYSVSHVRYPLADRSAPAEHVVLGRILNDIKVAIAGGRLVYVHCCGGAGRTGMVIGCWLAQQFRSGWRALASLDRMWLSMDKARFLPRTPETDEQIRTVLAWPEAARIGSAAEPVIAKPAGL
jgi:hypothetical protein